LSGNRRRPSIGRAGTPARGRHVATTGFGHGDIAASALPRLMSIFAPKLNQAKLTGEL
jgi:hypothetical protein